MTNLISALLAFLLATSPAATAQWVAPHYVMFERSSDAPSSAAADELQRFALSVANRRLVINGHADRSEGDEKQTLDLSYRRAVAVRQHLLAYGVGQSQMSVRALGTVEPSIGATTATQNQRVEIVSALAQE